MKLTPLDIRKQEFSRGLRGYDAEEVQAFLQVVSNQWEEMQDTERRLQQKVQDLESKLAHYQKVEEALQEALQTSRESSRQALESARQKADVIVQNAEADARAIRRDAEQDVHRLKREAEQLTGRRDEIAARLRAFLASELELLSRLRGESTGAGSELLSPSGGAAPPAPGRQEAPAPAAGPAASAEPQAEPPVSAKPTAPTEAGGSAQERAAAERAAAEQKQPAAEAAAAKAPSAEPSEAVSSGASGEGRPPSAQGAMRQRRMDIPLPVPEEGRTGSGWRVRPVVTQPTSEENVDEGEEESGDDEPKVTQSNDEIERIRRILRDLD